MVIAQVNNEWMLIDGRNRLAACKLVEVTPHYRVIESDPTSYVLSANVHRRHLTKGQQAMAVALAYPEVTKYKRGRASNLGFNPDLDASYINKARFVLHHCRDKAEEVLKNYTYPLSKAYEQARVIVEEQRKEEEERQRQLAALAVLREEYSDLAALVDDQRLGLPEAIAVGEQRREEARLKAEREREAEVERLLHEADLSEKVKRIREHDEDLANQVASEEISFEKAMSIIEERETTERRSRVGLMTNLNGLVTNSYLIADIKAQRELLKLKGYWVDFQSSTQYSIDHVINVSRKIKENIDSFISVIEELR